MPFLAFWITFVLVSVGILPIPLHMVLDFRVVRAISSPDRPSFSHIWCARIAVRMASLESSRQHVYKIITSLHVYTSSQYTYVLWSSQSLSIKRSTSSFMPRVARSRAFSLLTTFFAYFYSNFLLSFHSVSFKPSYFRHFPGYLICFRSFQLRSSGEQLSTLS